MQYSHPNKQGQAKSLPIPLLLFVLALPFLTYRVLDIMQPDIGKMLLGSVILVVLWLLWVIISNLCWLLFKRF